jgi:Type II CAAX prenyl endopeptidase Rce1-like
VQVTGWKLQVGFHLGNLSSNSLSALFGLIHLSNKGETLLGGLMVVSFGLLLCLFLRRTGTLWCAVGFHLGYDWSQTFFYGVPNSGLTPSHNLFNVILNGPQWLTGRIIQRQQVERADVDSQHYLHLRQQRQHPDQAFVRKHDNI